MASQRGGLDTTRSYRNTANTGLGVRLGKPPEELAVEHRESRRFSRRFVGPGLRLGCGRIIPSEVSAFFSGDEYNC
jgi:hypothetical protein